MSDVGIEKLRTLRRRSDELLKWAGQDLRAFLNKDGLTFVRTAESPRVKGDVNVTTTCSCLMALALSGHETNVYRSKNDDDDPAIYAKGKVGEAFDELVKAPWMSSGLTENNAFTTSLVIRTLGFLRQRDLISAERPEKPTSKRWYRNLAIADKKAFIELLQKHEGPLWDFVWRSFSDKLRYELRGFTVSADEKIEPLVRAASRELQRLLELTWFYTLERFPDADPEVVNEERTAYERAAFNYDLLVKAQNDIFKPGTYSLRQIASELGADPKYFTINEYDPSAAVIYWFVDGVTRAEMNVDRTHWHNIAVWATEEFNHQMSLVVSKNEAMMDPVSMAMAACLCARLKTHAVKAGADESDLHCLPSQPELEHSIKCCLRTKKTEFGRSTSLCFITRKVDRIIVSRLNYSRRF